MFYNWRGSATLLAEFTVFTMPVTEASSHLKAATRMHSFEDQGCNILLVERIFEHLSLLEDFWHGQADT